MAIAPFNPPGNRRIAQLPPTIGIKDPAMREFADAMTNILNSRSGDVPAVADQRFITEAEFKELAGKSMIDLFSTGVRAFGAPVPGAGTGTGTTPTATEQLGALDKAFKDLEDAIRRSILYQILGTQFQLPQITELRKKFEADLAKQGFSIIQTINAQNGLVETVEGIATRVDDAEAAIITEMLVRADDDTALARVINTLWATLGDNTSIIEDGALAAAGQVSATATKWNAVVASVTDPNTGLVNSASIKEQMEVYANLVNSALTAAYTVRVQTSVGGQTVMGGFGITATASAGTGTDGLQSSSGSVVPGSLINFGVRADTFFVAATSSTPSDAAQLASPDNIPFIVLTNPVTIDGVVYPAGVWMRRAVIQVAQIGTANIIVANITTALIGGAAVMTPIIVDQGGSLTTSTSYQLLVSGTIVFDADVVMGTPPVSVNVRPVSILALVTMNVLVTDPGGTSTFRAEIRVDGVTVADYGVRAATGSSFAPAFSKTIDTTSFAAGSHTVAVYVKTDTAPTTPWSVQSANLLILGGKR